jgi:co-chaperonin GroES (HSP10)
MFADNVLVCLDWLRDQRQDVTSAGGIFIPAQARKPETVEATWGTVVAAGPGHHDEYGVWQPMDVAIKPGARVLVDMAQAGDSCMLDDVEHRIIRQKNIPLVQED